MKLKKLALRALGGLMSLALVACMLTSCSKSGSGDKLVENIPASAFMVVKINPQQIIENAGCTVDNGKSYSRRNTATSSSSRPEPPLSM